MGQLDWTGRGAPTRPGLAWTACVHPLSMDGLADPLRVVWSLSCRLLTLGLLVSPSIRLMQSTGPLA
jgi:hypothetical protein